MLAHLTALRAWRCVPPASPCGLREYERRLQDADVLEPTSAVALVWNRVRDRAMGRGR